MFKEKKAEKVSCSVESSRPRGYKNRNYFFRIPREFDRKDSPRQTTIQILFFQLPPPATFMNTDFQTELFLLNCLKMESFFKILELFYSPVKDGMWDDGGKVIRQRSEILRFDWEKSIRTHSIENNVLNIWLSKRSTCLQ